MNHEFKDDMLPRKHFLSLQINLQKFSPATDEEKQQHETMRESTTFFRDGMRKLMKNPLAVASMIVLIILTLTIIIVPAIYPYSYSQMITVDGKRDKTAKNLAPFEYSKNEQKAIENGETIFPHIFGTDELCRDYFIRVVFGARVSLLVGLFASLIVLVIGLLYGSISGYFGGRVDLIMMRIVDIIYSLPDTLMVILLSEFWKLPLMVTKQTSKFPIPSERRNSALVLSPICALVTNGSTSLIRSSLVSTAMT